MFAYIIVSHQANNTRKKQREITTNPLSTWVHTALLARTRMKKEVGRLGLAYMRERERERERESTQLFGTTK